jgi:hypothetical protein
VSQSFSFLEAFRWNPANDSFDFPGYMNSYLLEQVIAIKRGIPPHRRKEIYDEVKRRAKIFEKLHTEKKVTDFYDFFKILAEARRQGSYKPVTPFDMFYQLTYMSAMASAGISRSKTFEIAAQSKCSAAPYFVAVNTLVDEFRYDYPDACRMIGQKAASENIRTFLLRLSDALRSGEPLGDFLTREADVQGEDYKNAYERNLENLKQWTNAFSSITISVGLIIIIQMITSMIYSSSVTMMAALVFSGGAMAGFGAWIIYRSAPREHEHLPVERLARTALRLPAVSIDCSLTILLPQCCWSHRQRGFGVHYCGCLPAAGWDGQPHERPHHHQERHRVQHFFTLNRQYGDFQRHHAEAGVDKNRSRLISNIGCRYSTIGHTLAGASRS